MARRISVSNLRWSTDSQDFHCDTETQGRVRIPKEVEEAASSVGKADGKT